MRYRFTHIYPEIFAHLTHGVDAIVHRTTEGSHYSNPEVSPEGSTVVLEPGDELETTVAQDHPHLEPVDQAAQAAAPQPVPAEPSPEPTPEPPSEPDATSDTDIPADTPGASE